MEALAANTRVVLTWPRALAVALLFMVLAGGRGPIFLCALLAITLAVASVAVRAGARGLLLRYELQGDRLPAGGRAHITVTVVNRSPWPLPLCTVAARLPDGLHGRFQQVLTLPGRSLRRTGFEVTAIHRGVYRLGDSRVELSDWFGLWQQRADVPVPVRLVVLPGGEDPGTPGVHRLPAGPRRDPLSPFGDELPAGIRPYRPGDPLRAVAWKQSARLGELRVREYPRVREGATWIFLDLCAEEWEARFRHDRTEAAIGAAAALVRREAAARRPVGLTAWGTLLDYTVHGPTVTAPAAWLRAAPGAASGQALHLLELLAALHPAPGADFTSRLRLEARDLPFGTEALLVVPRDTPELWRLGAEWQARGHPVTLLVCERRMGPPPGIAGGLAPRVWEVGADA